MLPEPHSNSHQPLLGNRVYMWRLSFLVILNALTSKLGSRNIAGFTSIDQTTLPGDRYDLHK